MATAVHRLGEHFMVTITLEGDNLGNAIHQAIDVLNRGGIIA